jgi:hypothetical protein
MVKVEMCRCFLHRQEQGGKDHAFQFQNSLANELQSTQ